MIQGQSLDSVHLFTQAFRRLTKILFKAEDFRFFIFRRRSEGGRGGGAPENPIFKNITFLIHLFRISPPRNFLYSGYRKFSPAAHCKSLIIVLTLQPEKNAFYCRGEVFSWERRGRFSERCKIKYFLVTLARPSSRSENPSPGGQKFGKFGFLVFYCEKNESWNVLQYLI